MGYTHYWYLKPDGNEANYQKAKSQIARIVRSTKHDVNLGDAFGNRGTKPVLDKDIRFNGIEDESHETFCLSEYLRDMANAQKNSFIQRDDNGFVFNFCKTARKPYDTIVTACLIVLKHYLGNDARISSDGMPDEWVPGLELAKSILRIKTLDIPAEIKAYGEE